MNLVANKKLNGEIKAASHVSMRWLWELSAVRLAQSLSVSMGFHAQSDVTGFHGITWGSYQAGSVT